MQVQLLGVHRYFHKHNAYANNLKEEINSMFGKRRGAQENEKRLETTLGQRSSPTIFVSSPAAF